MTSQLKFITSKIKQNPQIQNEIESSFISIRKIKSTDALYCARYSGHLAPYQPGLDVPIFSNPLIHPLRSSSLRELEKERANKHREVVNRWLASVPTYARIRKHHIALTINSCFCLFCAFARIHLREHHERHSGNVLSKARNTPYDLVYVSWPPDIWHRSAGQDLKSSEQPSPARSDMVASLPLDEGSGCQFYRPCVNNKDATIYL